VETNYSSLPRVHVVELELIDPWEESWFMPTLYVIWGIAGVILLITFVKCLIKKRERDQERLN